jgi:pimeloyl-ACP methyl ester carboxylesterase
VTRRAAGAVRLDLGDGLVGRCLGGGSEAVLWIHGYTMDSSVWRDVWARLPGWRHIGVDLLGHGASRAIGPHDDLPGLANRIANIASAVRARHLVALSFGTLVAIQTAIQHPRAFASVVLAAPALADGPQDPAVAARYIELGRLYRQRGPGPHLRSLWMSSPPDVFRGAAARPRLWRHLCDVIDRHSWRELADGRMYQLTSGSHTRANIERIQAAILVVIGEHELPVFRRCACFITSWAPRACAVLVPDAGHLCLLESPSVTAPAIDQHLTRWSS